MRQVVERQRLPVDIALLITNKPTCAAVEWAKRLDIPIAAFGNEFEADPIDQDCLAVLRSQDIDLIVLSGFLRMIGPRVLAAYEGRILNSHPALLPNYGGKGMYGLHVHRAVLAAGEPYTGATLHRVDAAYDEGPIVLQCKVPIQPDDSPEVLSRRVIAAEGELLAALLTQIAVE